MKVATPRIINGSASIFLDCLRLGAALMVLYRHAFDRWFPTKAYRSAWPGEPSHVAVIVFFVLSGYVIAHTTISNNRGGMQYAQARLSRLCSVVIPVIIITVLIQLLVMHINPEVFLKVDRGRGNAVLRYLLSAFYMNELWFLSGAPPINGSLWSLSFEFWYYTIFGIWAFRRPGWQSTALLILAIVIAGPKIIVMMPVWLAGYLAYRIPAPVIAKWKAWLTIFLILLAGYLVARVLPPLPYVIHLGPLYYANQFFTDWVLCVFVAGALWILPAGSAKYVHTRAEGWFRAVADVTFPLYVLHYPLLVLWRAVYGFHFNDTAQMWKALICIVIIVAVIGVVLEKQRPWWSAFFKKLLIFLRKKYHSLISTQKKPINS